MARTIKAPKKQILNVILTWRRAPASKAAEETARFLNIRRALRKPLEKYLEERGELEIKKQEEVQKQQKILEKELKSYREQLARETSDDKKALLRAQMQEIATKYSEELVEKYDKKMEKLDETLKQQAEVTFDNEEFLYLKEFLTKNAAAFFSVPTLCQKCREQTKETVFDDVLADSVFSFLDSAV